MKRCFRFYLFMRAVHHQGLTLGYFYHSIYKSHQQAQTLSLSLSLTHTHTHTHTHKLGRHGGKSKTLWCR